MSDEVFTAPCTKCGKRRRLRLAYTEPRFELWLCRGCKAEHDEAVAGTRSIANRFRPRHADGEYIELIWDGPQTEHYVTGHVTVDEFRAEVARWYATEREGEPAVVVPLDAEVTHGYARSVRGEDDEFGYRSKVWQFQREPWCGGGHQMPVTRWRT